MRSINKLLIKSGEKQPLRRNVMKLKRKMTVTVLAISLVAGVALASTANAFGPGNGMMGGKGMRGGGQGCGCGVAYNTGPGMRNMMMTPGGCGIVGNCAPRMGNMMMSGGGCGTLGGAINPVMLAKRNQFLDATKELRKQIYDKQFAYIESSRNPSITQGELQAQQEELFTLRQELLAKRQAIFTAP